MESANKIKWAARSLWSRSIFIVSIAYFICAVAAFLVMFGILPIFEAAHFNPYVFIGFSIISLLLSAFICAYHLSTRIKRRKRKTDK